MRVIDKLAKYHSRITSLKEGLRLLKRVNAPSSEIVRLEKDLASIEAERANYERLIIKLGKKD